MTNSLQTYHARNSHEPPIPASRTKYFKRSLLRPLALVAATGWSLAICTRAQGTDAVLAWNEIMQNTVAAQSATFQARSGAIVQLAVFEAVNAITGDYEPYLGTIIAPDGASPEAAAIAAAHKTLVTLFSGSAASLDALRASSLAAIADGPAKQAGITVGEAAATAMLQRRANDGSANAQNVPYTPGSDPGDWRPTPTAFAVASQPGWGLITPFALESSSQFRSPPPPQLNSARYARDYNEVKLVGRIDSAFRPQDRSDVARFYAAASPTQVWNAVGRQASLAQGKSLSENARIFALTGIAMCDAAIAVYETKYHYSFWRPVTAIRGGATDGNKATDADSEWLPLIPTPAFPSYGSGHGTVSGAARTVLQHFFGRDGHSITLERANVPGVVLNYTDLKQISDDIADARVYGGIHFRFDQKAGYQQGRQVAHFILENYLRSPADEGFGDEE